MAPTEWTWPTIVETCKEGKIFEWKENFEINHRYLKNEVCGLYILNEMIDNNLGITKEQLKTF